MDTILEIKHLSKAFGKNQVLKDAMKEWQQDQTLETERFSFIHPIKPFL